MDGVVDIWDFSPDEVAYSHKVGDAALSSVSVRTPQGGACPVGDVNGTVSLLEVCDGWPYHNRMKRLPSVVC